MLLVFPNLNTYSCELNIRLISMYSSHKVNNSLILAIYQDLRTVFRLNDISMLIGETNFQN